MKKYGLLMMAITALFLINQMTFAQKPETEQTANFLKAVSGGDVASVKAMLKTQPSLSAVKNESGMSAVMVAVYNGKQEVVDVLLATGRKLDIFEAAATGQTKRVKVLIAKNKSLVNTYSSDGFLPLGYAVFFGHDQAVSALLDAGADVNLASKEKMHVTPLHSAAAARRLEIARS